MGDAFCMPFLCSGSQKVDSEQTEIVTVWSAYGMKRPTESHRRLLLLYVQANGI
nr:unnamed protein product [Callosobruchus analis]